MRSAFLASIVAASLCGCANIDYYYQAMGGQMEIWNRSRPIEALVKDSRIDPKLRERLVLVSRVREFASRELALPDNQSYRKYADLQRPFAVWNVFATREFSIAPVEWCFPFAGCVAYRGYFSEQGAQKFGAQLRPQGHDVFVAGIPAYSTLGWFDDPVLNTFIFWPDTEIARLTFHELAHQVSYVSGDTVFNESFATAVELEGVDRWLGREGTREQRAAFDAMQTHKSGFVELVMKYRKRLGELYASALSDELKRSKKTEAFAELKAEYLQLKQSWNGFAGYDRFFAGELNNAHLVPVATYSELVPAFRRLLAENGGDFRRFYAQVKELGKLPKDKREARLGKSAPGLGRVEPDAGGAPALNLPHDKTR
ncbi:MAG TPA: aminopeptidase [Burkholderiales bacterium]|nr:aminopeptidase [Burkholderiales bacterium]